MPTDNELIGLSGSTPEGRTVALAGGLSGQTGWRRRVANVIAIGWLVLIGAGIAAAVVAVLR